MALGDGPTRIELLNQLAVRLNKNPPPNMDAATETRLAGFLNQRQRRLVTMPGLKRLRDATISFTTVANQASYGLPTLAKVSRIFETANNRVLYEMSEQDSRLLGPTAVIGTPEAFIWTGRQVVAKQPTDPSPIFVQSSNTTDTTQTLFIEGVLSGGYARQASKILTGTTPVALDASATTWERIDKCYLSAPAVGDVTVREDSGTGAILAFIPAGQVTSVYSGITLYPTPSAVMTYFADVTKPVTDLVQDTDQAAIPDEFADVLMLGALADELQHLADPRWSGVMAEYKQRENDLKYWLAETAIGRPFGLSRQWQRPSQLGSFFPSGT